MKEHRKYAPELKRRAVARISAGESATRVARDLKVDRQRLYEWCDKYREGGSAALRRVGRPRKAASRNWEPGEDELTAAKRRISELERKIGQQQVDLDFFRRALQHVKERQPASGGTGGGRSSKSSGR